MPIEDPSNWKISNFQRRVIELPESLDLFLGGGRGGAKSYLIALLLILHAERYREGANMLYIRRSLRAVSDFERIVLDLVFKLREMGRSITYNKHDHLVTWEHGARLELNQLDTYSEYYKF